MLETGLKLSHLNEDTQVWAYKAIFGRNGCSDEISLLVGSGCSCFSILLLLHAAGPVGSGQPEPPFSDLFSAVK